MLLPRKGDILMNNKIEFPKIDYSLLMDLRIDYAFKTFAEGNPNLLISLLNSIFANKKIRRVIKSINIKNPYLDKKSVEDKLSILDVRAELDDGTDILIEMHMYGLGELKAKTIRSWARAYSEELEVGQSYTAQPPTITIAFTNGSVESIENDTNTKKDKIHRICMIMDYEDYTVFTNAMELHYIDMKAFAEAVNTTNNIIITEEAMFSKWLTLITEKEINNKTIIENACKEEDEIRMAVTALQRQSEDKLIRQAYQRRKDEIYFYNKERAEDRRIAEQAIRRAEQAEQKTEQEQRRAEQAERKTEQEQRRAEQAEAEIAKLRKEIETLQTNQNVKK